MYAVELVNPLMIHGRLINTFASERAPMQVLGFRDVRSMRDYFLKKFDFNKLNLPQDETGNDINRSPEVLFQEGGQFFYESEIEIDIGDFYILASITIEGTKFKNRLSPGCSFKVIDAHLVKK